MSEMNHTPGPWWATDSGVRDRGGYICFTPSATHYPGQDERFAQETAERAANKLAITAVPELLAALRLAVRQNSHDMLMTGEELRQCEAALSKAAPKGDEGNHG